jgi:hypothetical protein
MILKWKAVWKEKAGLMDLDYTTWDAAAWVAAGTEHGFDGARVKPAEIFFLYVTMTQEDGAQLTTVAKTWGLDDASAANFVNFMFRTVYSVTVEAFVCKPPLMMDTHVNEILLTRLRTVRAPSPLKRMRVPLKRCCLKLTSSFCLFALAPCLLSRKRLRVVRGADGHRGGRQVPLQELRAATQGRGLRRGLRSGARGAGRARAANDGGSSGGGYGGGGGGGGIRVGADSQEGRLSTRSRFMSNVIALTEARFVGHVPLCHFYSEVPEST